MNDLTEFETDFLQALNFYLTCALEGLCKSCGHSKDLHTQPIRPVGGYSGCAYIDSEGPCTCEGRCST